MDGDVRLALRDIPLGEVVDAPVDQVRKGDPVELQGEEDRPRGGAVVGLDGDPVLVGREPGVPVVGDVHRNLGLVLGDDVCDGAPLLHQEVAALDVDDLHCSLPLPLAGRGPRAHGARECGVLHAPGDDVPGLDPPRGIHCVSGGLRWACPGGLQDVGDERREEVVHVAVGVHVVKGRVEEQEEEPALDEDPLPGGEPLVEGAVVPLVAQSAYVLRVHRLEVVLVRGALLGGELQYLQPDVGVPPLIAGQDDRHRLLAEYEVAGDDPDLIQHGDVLGVGVQVGRQCVALDVDEHVVGLHVGCCERDGGRDAQSCRQNEKDDGPEVPRHMHSFHTVSFKGMEGLWVAYISDLWTMTLLNM